jgi:hypothetical protein
MSAADSKPTHLRTPGCVQRVAKSCPVGRGVTGGGDPGGCGAPGGDPPGGVAVGAAGGVVVLVGPIAPPQPVNIRASAVESSTLVMLARIIGISVF